MLPVTKESSWRLRRQTALLPNFTQNDLKLVLKLDALNSVLDALDSSLDTWSFRVSRIKDRVARDCQLTFARYCKYFK